MGSKHVLNPENTFIAAKDPDCKLALGPHLESFTEIAFPMARDWHLKHEFKEAMDSMRDDGTLKTILHR
jgi:ABC-type amino acid transport substrate-binding protein